MQLTRSSPLALALDSLAAAWRERARRPVRRESELLSALGEPVLAARPEQETALRALCRQLLEHWFVGGRAVLPVVSAGSGEGRTRIARQLAAMFRELGVRTLVVDADVRASREWRLERLSGPEVPAYIAAAAQRYRVVLVDTPAAERGPDLQLFAALAGGALVISKERSWKDLHLLKSLLKTARAKVVATIFTPA
jgi:Mrp family chromosome partitioning ATPase